MINKSNISNYLNTNDYAKDILEYANVIKSGKYGIVHIKSLEERVAQLENEVKVLTQKLLDIENKNKINHTTLIGFDE